MYIRLDDDDDDDVDGVGDELDSFVGDCRLNMCALASNAAGITAYERLSFNHFVCVTLTLSSSLSVESWAIHSCANNKVNMANAFT